MATGIANKEPVKQDLSDDVEDVDGGERQLVDHHGAEGVEKDLKGSEEGFSKDGVEEKCFKGGGKVCVKAVDAKGFVVG